MYDGFHALCVADLSFWAERGRLPDYADYLARLENLNAANDTLFVFDLKAGDVTVREKPAPDSARTSLLRSARLPHYETFFKNVARRLIPDVNLSFALALGDTARGNASVPFLSFQKAQDDNLLLVPEIDSLTSSFYDDQGFTDDLDYGAKLAEAIFVGSTTGIDPKTGHGITNSRVYVDSGIPERIRAARYFADKPGVVFRLPNVAQCDTPETEEYLRAQKWTQGGSASWKQQYGYRLIISLDGNGATCSRIALALRSRSTLLKYDSSYFLYYTRALIPGQHYLAVSSDEDVLRYVRAEQEAAALGKCRYDDVSRNASAFYRKYLGKQAQHGYAAVLLNELHRLFHGEGSQTLRERLDRPASPFDVTAHVANVGDQWYWPEPMAGRPGSNATIEAFTIGLNHASLVDDDLQYQCLHADETPGPWVRGGTLCGEKGRSRRLLGLRMRLIGVASHQHQLQYRGTFTNGGSVGWTPAGLWCVDPRRGHLESFEIRLQAPQLPNS